MGSGTARWELKAKERDGGVEVEFEVDSNVVGQEWAYTLSGPDGVLSSGTRTTTGPSGSFSVEVKTSGSANDTFVGQATFGDQECTTGVNAGVGDDDSDDDSSDDKGKDDKGKDDKAPARPARRSPSRCARSPRSVRPNSRWIPT